MMHKMARRVGPLLLASLAAACSTAPIPLDRAPGLCAETRDFAFVGIATLKTLGFDEMRNELDFLRPGRFWATAGPVALPLPDWAPSRPPSRMLCVEWLDGRDIGMQGTSIPEDWVAPSN